MSQPEVEPTSGILLPAKDYNLEATLASGQAFRWIQTPAGWESVVGNRWVRLSAVPGGIRAETAVNVDQWDWLTDYLQTDINLDSILESFPADGPMQRSVAACRGLRLLRQDPWECLASFILSSTKQIVQIRQIVSRICQQFGTALVVPPGHEPLNGFPAPEVIARTSESELRACKMGFRAPNLLHTATLLVRKEVNLSQLHKLTVDEARAELLKCPGVGRKIADCVLLFAYGFQSAFPVDVWVEKALRTLYFPKRRPTRARLERFLSTHFGPNAGYAQQYLFHYARVMGGLKAPDPAPNN